MYVCVCECEKCFYIRNIYKTSEPAHKQTKKQIAEMSEIKVNWN